MNNKTLGECQRTSPARGGTLRPRFEAPARPPRRINNAETKRIFSPCGCGESRSRCLGRTKEVEGAKEIQGSRGKDKTGGIGARRKSRRQGDEKQGSGRKIEANEAANAEKQRRHGKKQTAWLCGRHRSNAGTHSRGSAGSKRAERRICFGSFLYLFYLFCFLCFLHMLALRGNGGGVFLHHKEAGSSRDLPAVFLVLNYPVRFWYKSRFDGTLQSCCSLLSARTDRPAMAGRVASARRPVSGK